MDRIGSQDTPLTPQEVRARLLRVFPGQVRSRADLCGRARELTTINDILTDSAHKLILVMGEPRIGKTSLLTVSARLWEETAGGAVTALKIEPQGITSREQFAHELWDGIAASLDADEAPGAPSFAFPTVAGFARRLDRLTGQVPGQKFVVYVDEFDTILRACRHRNDLKEAEGTLGLVRHLIESCALPLVFVFSAMPDVDKLIGHSLDSPITNNGITISLGLLTLAATEELVEQLLAGYTGLAGLDLAQIHEISGGHPYMIKLVLVKLLEQLSETGADYAPWLLGAAVQAAVRDPQANSTFTRIYRADHFNDAERYLLLWRAGAGRPLLASEVVGASPEVRTAARQLMKRGYLLQRGDDGTYDWVITLFQDWFMQWPEFEQELEERQVQVDRVRIPEHGLCIDARTERVYLDGQEVTGLSKQGYRALYYLAWHAGRCISNDELTEYVWAPHPYVTDNGIATLISRLRSAIRDNVKPYKYLENVHGRGYILQRAVILNQPDHAPTADEKPR